MYFNQSAVNDSLFNQGLARLSATSSLALTASLSTRINLMGAVTFSVTGLGAPNLKKPLAASAACVALASADLRDYVYYRPYTFNGSVLNGMTLNAPNPTSFSGAVSLAVTTAAALRLATPLAGATTGTLLTTAALTGPAKLAASITVTLTATGLLQDSNVLAGASTLVVVGAAALNNKTPLMGQSSITVIGSGSLARTPLSSFALAAYTPTFTAVSYAAPLLVADVASHVLTAAVQASNVYANATY